MMMQISYIMNMLNWNNDKATQERGILLAKKIKNISIFIQPEKYGNKAIWNNCAVILK